LVSYRCQLSANNHLQGTIVPTPQEASGEHIFTGSAAVKWFVHNMEGVSNVQVARVSMTV